jgi:hypothetical protein
VVSEPHIPGKMLRVGYIPWPPRLPDLTSMDFSSWEFVNDLYIQPMPEDFQELRERVFDAIAVVDTTFLNKLLDELEYPLDVCRILVGSQIEHL